MRQNTLVWATIILVLLLPTTLAANFDLHRVNYPDPVIGVTFNEPVKILNDQTNLIFTETNTNIGLVFRYLPDGDFVPSPTNNYAIMHEIKSTSNSVGGLTQGPYVLSVTGKNDLGLSNNVSLVSFEVTGLRIKLFNPENGYSPVTPYPVTVQTYVLDQTPGEEDIEISFNAECKYMLGHAPALDNFNDHIWKVLAPTVKNTSDDHQYQGNEVGTFHTTPIKITSSQTIFSVICQQYKLNGDLVAKPVVEEFSVGYLNRGPEIGIAVNPPLILNHNFPYSEFTITTDQEATCTIARGTFEEDNPKITIGSGSDFGTAHKHIVQYNNDIGVNTNHIESYDLKPFYYTIECMNRAGILNHNTTNVTVNFGEVLDIAIEEPSTLTNKNPVKGIITTNLASICWVDDRLMSAAEQGLRHSLSLTTIANATYTSSFYCEYEDKNATENITFTTDRLLPTAPFINSTGLICDHNASAYFSAEDNDEIFWYVWELLDATGAVFASGTTGEYVEVTVPAVSAETFTWRVYATDMAGNNGSTATKPIITRPGNSDECDTREFFINYYTPVLGWDTESFIIEVETKRPAECEYILLFPGVNPAGAHINATATGNIIHEFTEFTFANQSLHVRCTEPDATMHERVMNFGILMESLKIEDVDSIPNPVIDFQAKETTITVTTNHDAACTLSLPQTGTIPFDGEDDTVLESYTTTHEHKLNLSFITELVAVTLDYSLICVDKALQSESKPLAISVDFISAFSIDVFSPPRYLSEPGITLTVQPSVPALCTYRTPDEGIAGDFHNMSVSNGIYSKTLGSFDDGPHTILIRCINAILEQVDKPVRFTIDSTPPSFELTGENQLCRDKETAIIFESNERLKNKTITVKKGTAVLYTATVRVDRHVIKGINYTVGDFLTITGVGVDNAGNPGSAEMNVTIISATDVSCNLLAIVCGNNLIQSGEQCDGPSLGNNTECSARNANLVGVITSCNADCTFNTSSCQSINGTVIGGPGVEPTCYDGVKNGYETGVDCGGSCASSCESTGGTGTDTGGTDTDTDGSDDGQDDDPVFIPEDAFPWLALILLILGLLTMTGASYYLYEINQEVQTPVTQQPTTPPPMNRENTVTLLKQQQEKQEAFKKHAEQNTEDRHKLTQTFSEAKPESSDSPTKPSDKKPEPSSEEKSSEKIPDKAEQKAEKKTKDVFDRLDEFIDDANEGKK